MHPFSIFIYQYLTYTKADCWLTEMSCISNETKHTSAILPADKKYQTNKSHTVSPDEFGKIWFGFTFMFFFICSNCTTACYSLQYVALHNYFLLQVKLDLQEITKPSEAPEVLHGTSYGNWEFIKIEVYSSDMLNSYRCQLFMLPSSLIVDGKMTSSNIQMIVGFCLWFSHTLMLAWIL